MHGDLPACKRLMDMLRARGEKYLDDALWSVVASSGNLDAIKLLLAAGTNVNRRLSEHPFLYSDDDDDALDEEVYPYQLFGGKDSDSAGGSDSDSMDSNLELRVGENATRTVVAKAVETGRKDVLDTLLAARPTLLGEEEDEVMSALTCAVVKRRTDMVEALSARGANVESCDDYYVRTPLIDAACLGHSDIVDLLLAAGSNVNHESYRDGNALTQAARNGHKDIVQRLLKEGADMKVRTCYNETALDLAKENGHKEVVHLLKCEKEKRRTCKG